MNFFELKNDPIVIEWLDTINARPNTIRNYLLALKVFCNWTEKTPD